VQSNDPQSYLASGQARTVAYALDLVACALLLMPAGIGFFLAGTPQAGGFEFALILFAFHTFFLSFREGASPGKYAHNIAVLSATGRPLPSPNVKADPRAVVTRRVPVRISPANAARSNRSIGRIPPQP